jgi:hypothetical protein
VSYRCVVTAGYHPKTGSTNKGASTVSDLDNAERLYEHVYRTLMGVTHEEYMNTPVIVIDGIMSAVVYGGWMHDTLPEDDQ